MTSHAVNEGYIPIRTYMRRLRFFYARNCGKALAARAIIGQHP